MALIRRKNPPKESLSPSEHQIQVAFFEYVRLKANEDWRYQNVIAVPNSSSIGGRIAIATAIKKRKEGVSKGFPDVFVFFSRHDYHGLALEFKTETGRLSPSQKEWEDRLKKAGYFYARPCNVETAIYFLDQYLNAPLLTGHFG